MNKKELKNIKELAMKPELYLGIATLCIVVAFVIKATFKPAVHLAFPSVTSTPAPTVVAPTKVVTAKQVVAQKTEEKKSMKQIKKFADTGAVVVTVKEGDSFWKIAEKVCGTGAVANTIQEQNGYENVALQPGDTITVSCN